MMKALFSVLLLMVLVSGCGGCATAKELGPYGGSDHAAVNMQHIMKQSVAVRIKVILPDVKNKKLVQKFASGSGTVIRYDRASDRSMVLSAAHVCNVPSVLSIEVDGRQTAAPVLGYLVAVENHKGEMLRATILFMNKEKDTCVLDVFGWAGETTTIAKALPPIGARLVSSGAPRGTWDRWFHPIQEGIFFGMSLDEEHDRVLMGTSIPTCGGMSGSGVYYRGRLVGMVIMVMKNFEHSSYLVNLVDIAETLLEASQRWQPNPKSTSPSPK